MSEWIQIDDAIGTHPRFVELADKHFLPGIGLHLLGIAYCNTHRTDGLIPKAAMRRVVPVPCKPVLDDLLRVGLWFDKGDHYEIHDYLQWQRSAAEIAAASKRGRNAANARWGNASGNANSNADCNASGNAEEKRREEREENRGEESGTVGIGAAVFDLTSKLTAPKKTSLPPCLSTKFPDTRWLASDGSRHDTAAKALLASVQLSRGATLISPEDHGLFCGIVAETCRPGCTGTEDEVAACLKTLLKAAEKAGGKPSALFRKIAKEDR